MKKVDRNLDEINATMRTTQKHISAMKSMFSGFKFPFGRSNTVDGSTSSSGQNVTSPEENSSQSKLSSVVSQVSDVNLHSLIYSFIYSFTYVILILYICLLLFCSQIRESGDKARIANHPALRQKGIVDTSGFAANFSDDDEDDDQDNLVLKTAKAGMPTPDSRSKAVEEKVNNDLELIGNGLSRLKSLAHGFSAELDDQLSLLNNVNTKADQAEGAIAYQNSQMNRLLKR